MKSSPSLPPSARREPIRLWNHGILRNSEHACAAPFPRVERAGDPPPARTASERRPARGNCDGAHGGRWISANLFSPMARGRTGGRRRHRHQCAARQPRRRCRNGSAGSGCLRCDWPLSTRSAIPQPTWIRYAPRGPDPVDRRLLQPTAQHPGWTYRRADGCHQQRQ